MITESILMNARVFRNNQIAKMDNCDRLFPGESKSQLIDHCNRVEQMVIEIGEAEQVEKIEALQLAAILHDVGRVHSHKNHALIGAEMVVKEYGDKIDETTLNQVASLVREHSNKTGVTLEQMVLDDADLLDETGAMGILMQISNVPKSDKLFYDKVRQSLNREQRYQEKIYKQLRTKTGKIMMKEKMKLLQAFNYQLEKELR